LETFGFWVFVGDISGAGIGLISWGHQALGSGNQCQEPIFGWSF